MTAGIKSVIGDAKYAVNVLDIKHVLFTGALHEMSHSVSNIPAGGSFNIAFTTAVNVPVGLFAAIVKSTANISLLETHTGGTVSGGSPVTQFPRNHNHFIDPPFQSINDGVTVDVPGPLIAQSLAIRGSATSHGDGGAIIILRPDFQYYFTVTNEDNQVAEFMSFDLLAARLI